MSAERRWQVRVEHMLAAIARIQKYVAGLTEEQFVASDIALDAVIRNFQVMGEAVRHIPDEIQVGCSDVPWRLIEGMRHVLVHDYYQVKVDVVWRTVQQNLPPLVAPLQKLLSDNP